MSEQSKQMRELFRGVVILILYLFCAPIISFVLTLWTAKYIVKRGGKCKFECAFSDVKPNDDSVLYKVKDGE